MNHMTMHPENKGNLIIYSLVHDEYLLQVDAQVEQQIYFCPWCGEKLPEGQRERWHEELERRGINWLEDPIPPEFTTDEWRRRNKQH